MCLYRTAARGVLAPAGSLTHGLIGTCAQVPGCGAKARGHSRLGDSCLGPSVSSPHPPQFRATQDVGGLPGHPLALLWLPQNGGVGGLAPRRVLTRGPRRPRGPVSTDRLAFPFLCALSSP